MSSYSQRQEPITYIRGYGVDLTTLLTAIHVVAAALAAFAFAMGYRVWCEEHLIFSTATFLRGEVWTPATDPFFHDLASENLWFVVGLAVFWWFGRELERFLGRSRFALLYAALVLVPVLVAFPTAMIMGAPMGIRIGAVSVPANFGIFLSFCILYPGAVFWPGIAAKWVAVFYTALIALVLIAVPAPLLLIPFGACILAAFGTMQVYGANRWFDIGEWAGRLKTDRAEKKFLARQRTEVKEEAEFNEAIDPILEKISREGIQSLTSDEKRRLERARARLLKKDGIR